MEDVNANAAAAAAAATTRGVVALGDYYYSHQCRNRIAILQY
jgi:hypothetical protein